MVPRIQQVAAYELDAIAETVGVPIAPGEIHQIRPGLYPGDADAGNARGQAKCRGAGAPEPTSRISSPAPAGTEAARMTGSMAAR